MAFSTGDPLLDAARKKAAITTAASGQTAYETRTGDLGNVVSPKPYAPNPVVTKPPVVTAPPAATTAPTVAAPQTQVVTPPSTGTIQPPPVTQTAPADSGSQISDATAFNPAVLAQILASLEAQYGLSAEQLMADQSEIGRLYQFISSNLTRLEAESLKGEQESSLGRGILRSGIHLENQANVERDFAERRASAEGEQAQQLTYIQNQLAQLQAQLEADKMAAAQGFGQQGLDYASQYAATAPAGGFPGAGTGGPVNGQEGVANAQTQQFGFGPAYAAGIPTGPGGPVQPGSTGWPPPPPTGDPNRQVDPQVAAYLQQMAERNRLSGTTPYYQ